MVIMLKQYSTHPVDDFHVKIISLAQIEVELWIFNELIFGNSAENLRFRPCLNHNYYSLKAMDLPEKNSEYTLYCSNMNI